MTTVTAATAPMNLVLLLAQMVPSTAQMLGTNPTLFLHLGSTTASAIVAMVLTNTAIELLVEICALSLDNR